MFRQIDIKIAQQIDARKERIEPEQAWGLLQSAQELTIAKGKKVVTLTGGQINRDEVLPLVIGPSGNLRAPSLRMGQKWVVGFNPELYQQIFG